MTSTTAAAEWSSSASPTPSLPGCCRMSKENRWIRDPTFDTRNGFEINFFVSGRIEQLKPSTSQGGLLYHILATLDDYALVLFSFAPHWTFSFSQLPKSAGYDVRRLGRAH